MKMNKQWKGGVFAVLALVCVQMTGCGSNPKPEPTAVVVPAPAQDELDAAIREASDYLNRNIPKGSKAVFLNIRSTYPDLSEYILSGISENAVNSRVFSVVDRRELDTIRSELDFQYSGEVSDDSAQAIGRMLGAQTIVSGSANKFGSLYRIQIKAIEVQSAAIQGQWNKNVPNGMTIAALTERSVPAAAQRPVASTGTASTGTAQTAQAPARPTVPATSQTVPIVSENQGDRRIFNGHQYQLFDIGMTWTQAKVHCERLGGHLVTITSQSEQTFIESLIANGTKNCYFIGGYCDADRRFKWVTGEPMSFTAWSPGEPNNYRGRQDKMHIYRLNNPYLREGANRWDDTSNDPITENEPFFGIANFGFICEWD